MSNQRTSLFAVVGLLLALSSGGAAPLPKEAANEKRQAVDRFGDPLPEFAIARLGTTRWRQPLHDGQVSMSPDGKRIVSVSDRATIVWEAETGKRLPMIPTEFRIVAATFLADGKTLLTLEDPDERDSDRKSTPMLVRHRDAATGIVRKEGRISTASTNSPFNSRFAVDGKFLLASGFSGQLEVFDTASRERLHSIDNFGTGTIASISDDGKRLALADESLGLQVHDLAQKKRILHMPADPGDPVLGGYWAPKLSPDGKWVIALAPQGLRVWEVDTGKLRRDFGNRGSWVTYAPGGKQFAFVPFERVANAVGICLCDAETFKIVRQFEKPETSIRNIAFSPDGKRILASEESSVSVWDVAAGKQTNRMVSHGAAVGAVVFAPDGRHIVSGSQDQPILWDIERQSLIRRFPGHNLPALALAISPDGKTLATGEGLPFGGSHEASIRIWNLDDGRLRREFVGHLSSVNALEFARDGKLVSGGSDERVCVWDPETGKRLFLLRPTAGHFALAPDGKSALVPASDGLELRDLLSGAIVRSFAGLAKPREDSRSSTNLASFGFGAFPYAIYVMRERSNSECDGTLVRWNAATGETTRKTSLKNFSGHIGNLDRSQHLSPDGKILAAAGRLWDSETGMLLHSFGYQDGGTTTFAFSPDGKRLATGHNESTVLVWDVQRLRLAGLWSNLSPIGDAGKAASDVLAASGDECVPFLADRVRHAARRELPHAATIALLRSGKQAEQFRAIGKLETTPASVFALQLAEAAESDDDVRGRIREVVDTLLAKSMQKAAPWLRKVDSNPEAAERLRELGPAALLVIRRELDRPVPKKRDGLDHVRFRKGALEAVEAELRAGDLENPHAVLQAITVLTRIDTPAARDVLQELRNGPAESPLARTAIAAKKQVGK
jgi:WD40 repeat protein